MIKKYSEYSEKSIVVKSWKTAIYIRLSKEDVDKKDESVSVENQRAIMIDYLLQNPELKLVDIYIDDGFTGTDFERPAWNRLIEDIESGKVNCVIVKDLNRLGRNYTESGELIDNYFERKGIRFISLNNCFDNTDENMNAVTRCITVGVTNVINESYSAMTSVSIRGTLDILRKQGNFIGAFTCYGYMKDPEDHHKLIIDKEAAEVVKLIFREFNGGNSVRGIVRKLNSLGIPNPTKYKQKKGMNFKARGGKNDGLWNDRTVRRYLQNEMYIGNMVQGKNKVVSYKIHECRAVPKENWYVVENTHEAIISREDFDRAQELFKKHIRCSPVTEHRELFAGLVRCADCGAIMSKKTNKHSYGTYNYYRCTTKLKSVDCTTHSIRIDKLEEAVLTYLKTMIALAVEYDKVVSHLYEKQDNKLNLTDNALDSQKIELANCKNAMLDLYPDWKAKLITREEYIALKERLTGRIKELEDSINNLENAQKEQIKQNKNSFAEHFKKYKNIDKLTPALLNELVESIYVYEDNRITIKIKYADALEEMLREIESNKEVA